MASYIVKVQFEGSLRRMSLDSGFSLEQLVSQTRNLFKVSPAARLELTYVDSDGDMVTMADDADLHDALVLQSLNPLRVTVTLLNNENTGAKNISDVSGDGKQQRKQKETEDRPENIHGKEGSEGSAPAAGVPTNESGVESVAATKPSENDGVKGPDVTASEESEQLVHYGIVCDVCRTRNIRGTRYKSVKRNDYDLCGVCFGKPGVDGNDYIAITRGRPDGRSVHFDRRPGGCDSRNSNSGIHRRGFENAVNRRGRPGGKGFLGNPRSGAERFSTPVDTGAEVCHPGVTCDGCKMTPIVGTRFKSTKKFNYDLCHNCFQKVQDGGADEYFQIDGPQPQLNPHELLKSFYNRDSSGHPTCPFARYGRPRSPRRVVVVAVKPQKAEGDDAPVPQNPAKEQAAGEATTEPKPVAKTTTESDEKVKADAVEQTDFTRKEDTTPLPETFQAPNASNVQKFEGDIVQRSVGKMEKAMPENSETHNEKDVQSNVDGVKMTPLVSANVTDKRATEESVKQQNNEDKRSTPDNQNIVDDWDPILDELQEMGFYNSDLNRQLLSQTNGSIKRVVKELVGLEMARNKGEKEK